jgi:hypothetical protein
MAGQGWIGEFVTLRGREGSGFGTPTAVLWGEERNLLVVVVGAVDSGDNHDRRRWARRVRYTGRCGRRAVGW